MSGGGIGSYSKSVGYVVGALTIAGGVLGKVKSGSTASLVAGGVSGALLMGGASMQPSTAGAALNLLVSLALAGRFVPSLMEKGWGSPHGPMSILSTLCAAVSGGALLGQ